LKTVEERDDDIRRPLILNTNQKIHNKGGKEGEKRVRGRRKIGRPAPAQRRHTTQEVPSYLCGADVGREKQNEDEERTSATTRICSFPLESLNRKLEGAWEEVRVLSRRRRGGEKVRREHDKGGWGR